MHHIGFLRCAEYWGHIYRHEYTLFSKLHFSHLRHADAFVVAGKTIMPSSSIVSLVAALVVLIGTYPSSPLLFILLSLGNQASFLLASLLLAVFSFLMWARKRSDIGTWSKRLWFLFLFFGIFLIVKISLHRTPIAVREFSVLICVMALLRTGERAVRRVLGRATSFMAILLAISLISVVFSYYSGMLDLSDWHVDQLTELSEKNPIVTRNYLGHDYYFPFYLASFQFSDEEVAFGINFVRQPLIFTEWTFTWYFLTPLALVAIGQRLSGLRVGVLSVLTIALGISYSVWGVIVLSFTLLLQRFGKFIRYPVPLIVITLVAIGGALYFIGIEGILGLIGGNKLEQYKFYAGRVSLEGALMPIGNPDFFNNMEEYMQKIYGIIFIVFIYGIIGTGLFAMLCMYGLWASISVLTKPHKFNRETYWAASATVFVVLMGLKLTFFVSFFQILVTGYLCMLIDADNKARGGNEPITRNQLRLCPLLVEGKLA